MRRWLPPLVVLAGLAVISLLWLILWSAPYGGGDAAGPASVTDLRPAHLAWFYKPPADGNLPALARNFDRYILTHKDEGTRDALRAQGASGPMLLYLSFAEIVDPGSCEGSPWGNQVAYREGDFCMLAAQHPDWFLRDTAGNPIASDLSGGMRSVRMDPGNAGWQAFWLERAREMQERFGWDGAFVDNVEATRAKLERGGHLPAAYPDDAGYQDAVLGFLRYIYDNYFHPQGRPLYANIIEVDEPAVWFKYLSYLDGAMIEAWAVDWQNRYLSPAAWEEQMSRAEKTQALGKDIILVSQGDRLDLARQRFAFASYLLVTGDRAWFRYTRADEGYSQPWTYPDYSADVGRPMGTRQCVFDWVCWREFTRAWAIAVPTTHSAWIVARRGLLAMAGLPAYP